jgi:quercetin dioxygenase-like cupin family protein
MHVSRRDTGTRRSITEHFTSPTDFTRLFTEAAEEVPPVMVGQFADGATTMWHSHTGPQLLLVLNGQGRIGTDAADAVILEVGDAILSAAGERHWHGAAESQNADVLSITWGETMWEDVAP